MPKLKVLIALSFFLLPSAFLFAQTEPGETLTIATYYPSPYGYYKNFDTFGETHLATEGGYVGIGTTAPSPVSYGSGSQYHPVQLDVNGYVATKDVWLKDADAGNGRWASQSSGKVVQIVSYETGEYACGTGIIPLNDNIPDNTQGVEYMTLNITPKSATNKLKIDVVFNGFNASGQVTTLALFRDGIANALAVITQDVYGPTAPHIRTFGFSHMMDVPDTATHTFRVRAGNYSANPICINGNASTRLFGGRMASSITITEYVP